MSKLFFDHLIILDDVEKEIKKVSTTKEEEHELWQLVDERILGEVLDFIFGKLPKEHHEEFLDKFHKAPYDENLLGYLTEKIGENIEELIREEIGAIAYELLEIIRGKETETSQSSEKKK